LQRATGGMVEGPHDLWSAAAPVVSPSPARLPLPLPLLLAPPQPNHQRTGDAGEEHLGVLLVDLHPGAVNSIKDEKRRRTRAALLYQGGCCQSEVSRLFVPAAGSAADGQVLLPVHVLCCAVLCFAVPDRRWLRCPPWCRREAAPARQESSRQKGKALSSFQQWAAGTKQQAGLAGRESRAFPMHTARHVAGAAVQASYPNHARAQAGQDDPARPLPGTCPMLTSMPLWEERGVGAQRAAAIRTRSY